MRLTLASPQTRSPPKGRIASLIKGHGRRQLQRPIGHTATAIPNAAALVTPLPYAIEVIDKQGYPRIWRRLLLPRSWSLELLIPSEMGIMTGCSSCRHLRRGRKEWTVQGSGLANLKKVCANCCATQSQLLSRAEDLGEVLKSKCKDTCGSKGVKGYYAFDVCARNGSGSVWYYPDS